MRIYNIQKCDNSNPNFRALRLKEGAEKLMESMSRKVIDEIDPCGELLKDTKFYHLDIAKEFIISHNSGDKLYPPFPVSLAGNSIIVKGRSGFNSESRRIKFDEYSEAQQAYENIKSCKTQLRRTAVIVKYLDEYEQKLKDNNPIEPILDSDSIEEKIRKLIKKYGFKKKKM